MKVLPARIDAVLRNPPGTVVLVYGEDAGLVRQRAALAVSAACGGRPSVFQLSTLVKEEHSRLVDEARATPLDGSRRVVLLHDGGDGITGSLGKLASSGCEALVVIEAGELSPRSKLRALVEKEPNWSAIACYTPSDAAVAGEIRRMLTDAGQVIEPDALDYLAAELGGDTARRRQEMDKLTLFAGPGHTITLADATSCCATEDEVALSDIYAAAMSGQTALADQLLAEAEWAGTTGPGLLAGFGGHVTRLLQLAILVEGGMRGDDAMKALRPPVFPRQADGLRRQLQGWRPTALRRLLAAITAADITCKRGGSRDAAIASKVILDATRHASR